MRASQYAGLKLLGVAWCMLAIPALTAPTAAKEDATVVGRPARLRVGISTKYPPLAFKENGEIRGVEADFARKLSGELDVEVTFVELPWKELIPALTAGRIDVIMAGMSITEGRSKLVSFTDSYAPVGQMALLRREDSLRFEGKEAVDRPGTRVGFERGTTGELFVREKVEQAELIGFGSADEGIAALRAGGIDVFIHDAPTVWRVTGSPASPDEQLVGRYRPLTREELAWAVRKDDGELRRRLNGVLARWKKSGEVEAVLDRWVPVRKITRPVTPPVS